MASDSSFVWLRPATKLEELCDHACKKEFFLTVYSLTLRSSVPLTDAHIKEALLHTFRKVPTLRLCFRYRGDILWACDMNREEIDFQVTNTQELVPAIESLLDYPYPTTEGPLWCARLFPAGTPGQYPRPELDDDFPYYRTLLLGNHHGIADGTTNVFVADTLLGILDDVIAGKPIDDATQHGKLAAGEETNALLMAKVEEIMKDEGHFQQIMKDINKSKQEKKLIPRTFPMPRDPDYKCQIVPRELDKENSQSFFKKCKKEGVTVNSGLTAVFNVSLVDFVRDGGLEQEFYPVKALQTVSLRRYWSGDTSKSLGVHMMFMDNVTSTPAQWRDKFWEYARSIHKSLCQGLQDKDAAMMVASMEGETMEEHFAERPSPECDYALANMGNLDRLMLTQGKHVRLASIDRAASCSNDPMYYLSHTINGRFECCLSYANDIISRENAEKLMNKSFDNLRSVIHM